MRGLRTSNWTFMPELSLKKRSGFAFFYRFTCSLFGESFAVGTKQGLYWNIFYGVFLENIFLRVGIWYSYIKDV